MALNLPNLSNIGSGKSVGSGIRTAGTGAPKALFGGGKGVIAKVKASAAPKTQVSPYDQVTLAQPYNPSMIPNQASIGYNADVSNAKQLAAMGQPTAASITTDYAGRGAAANSVYQDLASHLAGIQQATVAQGNAGAAGLGAQNAAAAAGAPNIAGAPVAPALPTAGAQAVLGAQTAAAGNYGGALQAAALSSGAQANQRALNAGTVASTDATNNTQKTLASLLSGLPSQSSREASMTDANQKVDAANLQTKLSIYQGNVTQEATLRSLGYHAAADKLHAQNALDLAQINQAGASARTADTNATRLATTTSTNRTRAQIAKDDNAAKVRAAAAKGTTTGTGGVTASQQQQALKQARAILGSRNKTGQATKVPTAYSVQYVAAPDPNPYAPKPKTMTITVSAADKASGAWKNQIPKGASILQQPVPKTYVTKQTGRTGAYTLWNQSLSVLKQAGYTDSQARQALKPFKPAGVK